MRGLLSAVAVTAPALLIRSVAAVQADPLPKPQTVSWGDSGPQIIGNLALQAPQNAILSNGFARATSAISASYIPQATQGPVPTFSPDPSAVAAARRQAYGITITQVTVNIVDMACILQHGIDESYTLDTTKTAGSITINAQNVYGALHAFTTLQQLVVNVGGALIIEQPVSITDKPNFAVRGVMIDTGRNYISPDKIKEQITGMALSKLNVLHWHLEDAQSWPVEIKSFPAMTKDAYTDLHGQPQTYSVDGLKDIIQYAGERGVRVVPEIDMPGHASSGWQQVDASILACKDAFWNDPAGAPAVEPNPGQLDILNNKTYGIVQQVYKDMSGVFTDTFFHVGGDELHVNCYNMTDSGKQYLSSGKTMSDLVQVWVDQAIPAFRAAANRSLVMWEDIIISPDAAAHSVPKDIIMQSWNNGMDNVNNLTQMGYQVIVSSSDFMYLDCGFGGWLSNDAQYDVQTNLNASTKALNFNYGGTGGSWCAPYKTWQRIYDYDFAQNAVNPDKVLGAIAPLWSEQVDDTVISTKTWPRAAALAELVWSGNRDSAGFKRTAELTQRILNFREYIVSQGVAAAPLQPKWCLRHPHACDIVLDQHALGKN